MEVVTEGRKALLASKALGVGQGLVTGCVWGAESVNITVLLPVRRVQLTNRWPTSPQSTHCCDSQGSPTVWQFLDRAQHLTSPALLAPFPSQTHVGAQHVTEKITFAMAETSIPKLDCCLPPVKLNDF